LLYFGEEKFGAGTWECYNDFVMVKSRKQSGFTLIELLLVIGILGILSVIGLTTFSSAIVRGKDTRRKNDLAQLAKSLEAYAGDFGSYPADDSNGGIVGCSADGSVILDTCPLSASGRFQRSKSVGGDYERIIYLDNYPEDPDLGSHYYYINNTSGGEEGFSLYASLENLDDRDVRRDAVSGDPDPDGWADEGADCGTGVVCNYKLTHAGVVRE